MIDGLVRLGRMQAGLRQARLSGAAITFSMVDDRGVRRDFSGVVAGSLMEGAYRTDKGVEGRWSATRK